MPPLKCHACGLPINDLQDKFNTVHCSVCNGAVHRACSSLPLDGSTSDWKCNACSNSLSQISNSTLNISHFHAIMTQLAGLNQGISICNSNVASCQSNIVDLGNLITAQSERIEHCFAEVATLKEENLQLRMQIQYLESKIQNTDDLHAEIRDRINRENNVIVTGLPENVNGPDDSNVIANILKGMFPDRDIPVVTTTRLGKVNNNKGRPLKVTLSNRQDAHFILSNRSKIPRQNYQNINIRADQTPAQRAHLVGLREELAKRKREGESDLTIKYIKSKPQIISISTDGKPKRNREEETSPSSTQRSKVSKSSSSASS